jgi:hypothetical protein
LYDVVVDRILERDFRARPDARLPAGPAVVRPGRLQDPDQGKRLVKALMTRLALAILQRSPDQARIPLTPPGRPDENILRTLFLYPHLGRPADGRPDDWTWSIPVGSFWDKGNFYYELEVTEEEFKAILEVSLLRYTSASNERDVGFLHDSLVYYFAGRMALAYYLEPGQPPREIGPEPEWYDELLKRVAARPSMWKQAFIFLGGALLPEHAYRLVMSLLAGPTEVPWAPLVDSLLWGLGNFTEAPKP